MVIILFRAGTFLNSAGDMMVKDHTEDVAGFEQETKAGKDRDEQGATKKH